MNSVVKLMRPASWSVSHRTCADPQPDAHRWSERPGLARVLKLLVLLGPIVVSVGFVAVASRVVRRPEPWYGVVGWWIGLTLASTAVLAVTERVMRKVLAAGGAVPACRWCFLIMRRRGSRWRCGPTRCDSCSVRWKPASSTTTDFQEAAERLVALAGALNAHDRMTRGHTERVRAYTLMIGEELHLPEADLDRLHWAGLVHDIGKLEVPPSILNKPGRPGRR